MINHLCRFYSIGTKILSRLDPIVSLLIRLWIFKSFFFSGWLKTKNWASTVSLFQNEYNVPILPAEMAAYLGTIAELTFPVFLLLGLFSRFFATALFFFNIACIVFYPFLWTEDGTNGLMQHFTWGLLILVIMAHGPGQISVDYLLNKKCPKYEY